MRTAKSRITILGAVAVCATLVAAAWAQKPPPPDMEALAREADEFRRGRQIGAAVIWGGLLVASILIGWVRMKARRERSQP